jgi:competence protein ComGC
VAVGSVELGVGEVVADLVMTAFGILMFLQLPSTGHMSTQNGVLGARGSKGIKKVLVENAEVSSLHVYRTALFEELITDSFVDHKGKMRGDF